MFACQAWTHISPGLNHRIFESACLNDKKLYRTAINDLATHLRKRPQKLLDMPRAERHALFEPLMGLPQLDILAQNLIILWLSTDRVDMLNDFLDSLGIEHDDQGCADSIPETMDPGKIAAAVTSLRKKYPSEDVDLYLRVFDRISGVKWELPVIKDEEASATA